MTPETVIEVGQGALKMAALMGAIPLLAALVVGLLIGMFQAATQINEMTLSFIPKLLILFLALSAGGPRMLHQMVDYTQRMISNVPSMIG